MRRAIISIIFVSALGACTAPEVLEETAPPTVDINATTQAEKTSAEATNEALKVSALEEKPVETTTETPSPTSTPVVSGTSLAYVVVDTDQSKCYDDKMKISCPQTGDSFHGQDAQYTRTEPRYVDNGDGTVTDLNTGLMWQRNPGDKKTYEEAVEDVGFFQLAGYDDWRLPDIKELYSLIIFSGKDVSSCMMNESCIGTPFLDTAFFDFEYGDTSKGERIIDSQYMSSTEYVSKTVLGAPSTQSNPPDFAKASSILAISEDALTAALGPPPPNFSAAAKTLGISEQDLIAALESATDPPPESQHNLSHLAKASSILGISEDTLMAALGPPPPNFSSTAKTLGISEQDLMTALESAASHSSGTEYAENELSQGNETVFGVNFADGRIKGYPKGPRPMRFFALYVRGNTAYGINDYNDNRDGTITDEATRLMWMKTDSDTALNWGNALAYCEDFDGSGHTDWRLPNAKELQSIVDYTRSPDTTSSAAIDPIFTTTSTLVENNERDYPFYWTSTTHVNSRGEGRWGVYVAFGKGLGYMSDTWTDVHGAGAQRSDPKIGEPTAYAQGHGPQGDAVRINNYVRCVRTN